MTLLARRESERALRMALARAPVTALVGPRQAGKTTLARAIAGGEAHAHLFDLEDPDDLRALDHPKAALEGLEGMIVIDEVQRRPELFPVLRVLVDRPGNRARFLVLGSASPDLLRQTSETLAGRIEFVELGGFDLSEVGESHWRRLWLRGGFPRAYLARNDEDAFVWHRSFIQTYLERDLPQLGLALPPLTLERFWTMVAHYHGQTWNSSDIARSLGVSDVTTRRYLDVLASAFLARQLRPWFENLSKRQVKAPKVYVRDTGVLHRLLGIATPKALTAHPKCGASWEGFVIEHVLRRAQDCHGYFWATHSGAELDLLLVRGQERHGFEIKWGDAPQVTRSMDIAREDLGLDSLAVVYPGTRRAMLAGEITLLPFAETETYLAEIGLRPSPLARRRSSARK